jgi:hypothetical protein
VSEAEARTITGLAIKAKSVADVSAMSDVYRFQISRSGPMLVASIMGVAGLPVPPAKFAAPFDYEGAIARLEGMCVQFCSVGVEGHGRRLNGVRERVASNVLSYKRGFCPYKMDRVLARQGKITLPPIA